MYVLRLVSYLPEAEPSHWKKKINEQRRVTCFEDFK